MNEHFHKLSIRLLKFEWQYEFGKSSPLPSDEYFTILADTLIIDQDSENSWIALCITCRDMDFPTPNDRARWLIARMWNVVMANKSLAWRTAREILADSAPEPVTSPMPPRRPRAPRKKTRTQSRSNRKY